MKKGVYLIFTILAIAITGLCQVQSLKIVRQKEVYTRNHPTIPTFTVYRPIIKSRPPKPLKKRLGHSLSPFVIMKTSLRDFQEDIYLWEARYEIHHNRNGILSISYMAEIEGGRTYYRDYYTTVNLRTGKTVELRDLFNKTEMPSLLREIRKSVRKRFNHARNDPKDCFAAEFDRNMEREPGSTLLPEQIGYKKLGGFFVSSKGVNFIYSFARTLAPEPCLPREDYLLTWKQLKPFIRRDGLLGQFVR